MPENKTPTPSSHELIAAAAQGAGSGQQLARAAAISESAFAIVLSALVAGLLLAIEYVFPWRDPLLMFGTIALYGVGVVAVVLLYQRRRRASRPGWSKRYGAGFAMTMALYSVGVALSVSEQPSSLAFWLPYAVLTAAPLVIAALWPSRR